MNILVVLLIAPWTFTGPIEEVPRLWHMPDDAIVETVRCLEWERGDNLWRAGRGAHIETESGAMHIPPGDVTSKSASDLFYTLELTCRDDLGGGIWDGP
jgi:hypothetical protein